MPGSNDVGLHNCRSEQVLQGTQDKLAAAREEVHTQKRQLAAQLKDEVLCCCYTCTQSPATRLSMLLSEYIPCDVNS